MAGAVGNYNAHMSAYPEIDWQQARGVVPERVLEGLERGVVARVVRLDTTRAAQSCHTALHTLSKVVCGRVGSGAACIGWPWRRGAWLSLTFSPHRLTPPPPPPPPPAPACAGCSGVCDVPRSVLEPVRHPDRAPRLHRRWRKLRGRRTGRGALALCRGGVQARVAARWVRTHSPHRPLPTPAAVLCRPSRAELFDGVARFNSILIDFDRDVWSYIRRACAALCCAAPRRAACRSSRRAAPCCAALRWVNKELRCSAPVLCFKYVPAGPPPTSPRCPPVQPGLLQAAHHRRRGGLLHHAAQGERRREVGGRREGPGRSGACPGWNVGRALAATALRACAASRCHMLPDLHLTSPPLPSPVPSGQPH